MATPSLSSSPEQISIYAELLPNLRQVSATVEFPQPGVDPAHCTARVTEDGTVLRIDCVADTTSRSQSLALPGRVQPPPGVGADWHLPVAGPGKGKGKGKGEGQELVCTAGWRLPLVGTGTGAGTGAGARDVVAADDGVVPWSAAVLKPGGEVRCRACGAGVVARRRVGGWMDLPSENWAEMMELWHCHKPEHRHGERDGEGGQKLAGRGYGANSAIEAREGVGLVDLMALLFAEGDCTGLTFSSGTFADGSSDCLLASTPIADSRQQRPNIYCTSCQSQLGYYNPRTSAVTLFKWQISCDATRPRLPGLQDCLASALLATTARSGSATCLLLPSPKFLSDDTPATKTVPHLWILNSNLKYTSTHREGPSATAAIKLLYRTIGRKEADDMLESLTSDAQDMSLPREAVGAVMKALAASCLLLPAKERVFKEWQVALLDRWDGGG